MSKSLSPKHQLFVDKYLELLPQDAHKAGTRAAIAAGYSERSAAVAATRLLKNDNVAAEIKARQARQAVKADEALAFLGEIMRVDPDDFLTLPGTFPYVDLAKVRRLGKTRMIKKLKVRGDGGIEIEWHNAQKANETVLRVLGLLKEGNTFNFTFNVSIELIFSTMQTMHDAGIDVNEFMEKAKQIAERRMAQGIPANTGG